MTASMTIGRRYAQAVLNLAQEQGAIERVGTELADFANIWREQSELRQVFKNPVYGADLRRQLVNELATGAQISELVSNTLCLLSDRRRMEHVPSIAEAYRTLAERQAGVVRAEVVTAFELPDAYFQELHKVLEAATGKKVVVARRIDPELIGGVVTKVGDKVFDGSVQHRLKGLKEELLQQT